MNGVLVVYASNPSRTPPFLQSILGNFQIPMVILARFLLLRKRESRKQLFAALAVFVGLFLSLTPSIFGLGDQSATASTSKSHLARIMWPVCFMLGFVPAAVMNVWEEKSLKDGTGEDVDPAALASESKATVTDSSVNSMDAAELHEITAPLIVSDGESLESNADGVEVDRWGHKITNEPNSKDGVDPLYFLFMTSLYQWLTLTAMVWTDMIPHFGTGGSFSATLSALRTGFSCYGFSHDCGNGAAFARGSVFVAGYVLTYFSGAALLRNSAGAVWMAVVSTVVTPIGALFWTLMQRASSISPFCTSRTWLSLHGVCALT